MKNSNSIGMLRFSGKPGEKAIAMAYIAHMKGIEFYYFSPEDVNIDTKQINAKKLVNNKWINQVISYPKVIDNDTSSMKVESVWNSLSESCYMTTQILGGKVKTIKLLKENNIFPEILIPQRSIKEKKEFIEFVVKHKCVVLKPIRGNQGRNIYFIELEKEVLRINFEGNVSIIPAKQIENFYDENVRGKNFVIQKYISSKTKHGAPFDIRIHVQRDGTGKWNTSKIYARIGSGESLVANISAGGSMANAINFLKARYCENAIKPIKKLKEIAENLPTKFQKFYEKEIDSLGIDLGVDESGGVWLFEINSFPGSKYFEFERARVRIDYLDYLLKTN